MDKSLKYSLVLSSSYVLVSSLYILLSGYIAGSHSATVENLQQIENIKGIVFIIVTGITLFMISFFLQKNISKQNNQIVNQIKIISDQRELIATSERRALSGTFAASIAHDINNVLSIIDFSTYELKSNSNLPENSKGNLEQIEKALFRIKEMAKRLMVIGREDVRSSLTKFDICKVLQDTVETARMHTRIRSCLVTLNNESEHIYVNSNPHVIEQCLINLLLNAADATKPNGKIEVICRSYKNSVAIEVHDNGPGVPVADREVIFSAFYTTKNHGTGLGLAGVKASIEILSGKVTIENSPLGGALFRISIPNSFA